MFHKPFRVKTQVSIKGSERKRLRSEFGLQFPEATPNQIKDLIPGSKVEMTVSKISVHSGEHVVVYSVRGNPMIFQIQSSLYPTVYAMWQQPGIVRTAFTTWPPVISKLQGGADLMLPGVVLPSQSSSDTTAGDQIGEVTSEPGMASTSFPLGSFERSRCCIVNVVANLSCIAVGKTAMSSDEMMQSQMKGKGVIILHTYKDQLWSTGDKSGPPLSVSDGLTHFKHLHLSDDEDEDEDDNAEQKKTPVAEADNESKEVMSSAVDVECQELENNETLIGATAAKEVKSDDEEEDGGGSPMTVISQESERDQVTVVKPLSTQDSMDELLDACFHKALKSFSKNSSDLPILSSNFFRNHILTSCPRGYTLDVKKTSYKKLSKFLEDKQRRGLIKVKELTKGVESIVEINRDHDEQVYTQVWSEYEVAFHQSNRQQAKAHRSMVVAHYAKAVRIFVATLSRTVVEIYQSEYFLLAASRDVSADNKSTDDSLGGVSSFTYCPPQFVDVYLVSNATLPLFKFAGKRKDEALTAAHVRQILVDYVKDSNLQDPTNKSQVQLDPVLSDATLERNEFSDVLRWDELVTRVLSKMTRAYEVTSCPGARPVVKKGVPDKIQLDVVQRGSNKKVTLVHNLEVYGIDPGQFASLVQHGVACSASVSAEPGKNKGNLVYVQGNQINYISKLLTEKYSLASKYIVGLEKAPKVKKK